MWGIPAVFVEAWLLHILLPTKIWQAFFESVAANAITTGVGLVVGFILANFLQARGDWPLGEEGIQILIGGIAVLWLVSVLIEGWALTKWEKTIPPSQIAIAAFIMNCVSYILGFAAINIEKVLIQDTSRTLIVIILSIAPFIISVIVPIITRIFRRRTTEQ